MPVSITIQNVERSNIILRPGSWSLNKRLVTETFTCTVYDPKGIIVPELDDPVRVEHDGHLLFGGRIKTRKISRMGGDGPLAMVIQCRGYEEILEKIVISGTIPAGPILTRLYELYEIYLQPKGMIWVGATSGGEDITDLVVVRTKLSDVFSQACKQVNRIWRVNGDMWIGAASPGDTPFAVNPMTSSDFLMGTVEVSDQAYDYANRLIIQSGGTGEQQHTETHTADGVRTHFPLTVEPKTSEQDSDGNWTHYYPTSVKVNGVDHLLDGSTGWYYDSVEHIIYTSGSPPSAGHHVVTTFMVGFPATVRVWNGNAVTSAGTWNYATKVDKLINAGHMLDLNQILVWGTVELSRTSLSPKTVKGTTYARGFYPLQSGTLLLPENGISDEYLLMNLKINDKILKPSDTHLFEFHMEFIEGGVPGRQWEELFREYSGQGSGGGTIAYGSGGSAGTPGSGGSGVLPVGTTIHLAGDNYNAIPVSTTPVAASQAIPNKFGGASFAGVWKLRVPMFLLNNGTLTAELIDQTTAAVLASVTTTKTATLLSNDFDFKETTFAAPVGLDDILLHVKVSSGTNYAVIGHATLVKES